MSMTKRLRTFQQAEGLTQKTCKYCGKTFYTNSQRVTYCSEECAKKYLIEYPNLEKRKNNATKYLQSEKGRLSTQRYRKSEKGKEAQRRYANSEKGKLARKRARERHQAKIKALLVAQKTKNTNPIMNFFRKLFK